MNKRNEIQQNVYDFIRKNDGGHSEQIRKETQLSRIMVDNCLQFLLGQESIFLWNVFGNCKIYKVTKLVIKDGS